MKLESSDFAHGESIPRVYGYQEENVNPPLTVNSVPGESRSLVLIVDDPDAMEPAGKVWDHWVVWNIDPSTTRIPRDWNPSADGATEGQNDYGETGYGGPNPPDGEHTYKFKLYALDTELDLSPGVTKADVERAMENHVLAEDVLEGTYAP